MITAWQIFPLHFLLNRTFQKIFIHQEAFYLLLCVLLIYFLSKSRRGSPSADGGRESIRKIFS